MAKPLRICKIHTRSSALSSWPTPLQRVHNRSPRTSRIVVFCFLGAGDFLQTRDSAVSDTSTRKHRLSSLMLFSPDYATSAREERVKEMLYKLLSPDRQTKIADAYAPDSPCVMSHAVSLHGARRMLECRTLHPDGGRGCVPLPHCNACHAWHHFPMYIHAHRCITLLCSSGAALGACAPVREPCMRKRDRVHIVTSRPIAHVYSVGSITTEYSDYR